MRTNTYIFGQKRMIALMAVFFLLFAMAVSFAIPQYGHAQSLENSAKCGSNVDFTGTDCAAEQKKQAVERCLVENPGDTQKCNREASKSSEKRLNNLLATVINVMSAIGGAIAVLAIVLGGLNYVTSQGDAQKASSARSYIIYSLVGLLIIAFAQVIVQFVLERTT